MKTTPTETSNIISVLEIETIVGRQPIIEFLQYGRLPQDSKDKKDIIRRAPRFVLLNGVVYRRSLDGVLLRCLSDIESREALNEVHSGTCGSHQSGPKLHMHLKRMGYYWPTMVADSVNFAKKCNVCQIHADFIHQPPEPLHPTVASWPFEAWGLDIIGPIKPQSSLNHQYILATKDYFSK